MRGRLDHGLLRHGGPGPASIEMDSVRRCLEYGKGGLAAFDAGPADRVVASLE